MKNDGVTSKYNADRRNLRNAACIGDFPVCNTIEQELVAIVHALTFFIVTGCTFISLTSCQTNLSIQGDSVINLN